jgi:hypothetical protein
MFPKLQKINALTDRGQAGVRVRAGLGPFRLANTITDEQCEEFGRSVEDTPWRQPSFDEAASPRLRRALRIKHSLQTAQKSAERGVGLLGLGAYFFAPWPESDCSPPRVVPPGSKCKAAGRAACKLPASLDPHEKSLDLSPR